jgi:hypothetical protein
MLSQGRMVATEQVDLQLFFLKGFNSADTEQIHLQTPHGGPSAGRSAVTGLMRLSSGSRVFLRQLDGLSGSLVPRHLGIHRPQSFG